jgi:transcriptional regulator with XRE-family HTH domain
LAESHLGNTITQLLRQQGMRPTQLARLAKIDHGQLSKIMHGKAIPSIDSLRRIATVLGVSPGRLLDGKIEAGDELTSAVNHLAGALYSLQHLNDTDQQKVLSIIQEVTQLFDKPPAPAVADMKSNLPTEDSPTGVHGED